MRLAVLLGTTALLVAGSALARDIRPIVNASTEQANDLRGLTWASDGKIYVSGHVGTKNEETRTVVGRFNADGTPDTGFGKEGFVEIDLAPGRQEQSLTIAELAGGDVVTAVNAVDEDKGQSVYLLRFDNTGKQKVAPSWGDAQGRVEVAFGWANAQNQSYPGVETPPVDNAWDLVVDKSGGGERLVMVGFGPAPADTGRTDNDRYVLRLNAADGTPDASFNGGKPFSYHSAAAFGDNARRAVVESDGSILAAGYTNLGDLGTHVLLLRLTSEGKLDQSFGNFIDPASSGEAVGLKAQPGVAVFNPFAADGGFAECYGFVKLSDGSYVTTGYGGATGKGVPSTLGLKTSTAPDVGSFKLTPGGTALDKTWGNNGILAIQSEGAGQPTTEDRTRGLVALADDRTVQVGRYGGIAAVFVATPQGRLDTSVDGDGIIQLGHPKVDAQFFSVKLAPDGKHVAVTTSASPGGARLVVLEVQG